MKEYFFNIFRRDRSKQYDLLIEEFRNIYKMAPIDFGGGCSYQKALTMAVFIKEFGLKKTADIGVYRGRSMFPQAIAHKLYGDGIVYGIDPYHNLAAIQNDNPELQESLDNFIKNTDFENMYQQVTKAILAHNLEKNCLLIRKKSEEAKEFFIENRIDLGMIHIDGNHDTTFVLKDVYDYLPLIQNGGIIIVDDISWNSVKPALEVIKTNSKLIGNIIDNENDFAAFIKNPSSEQFASAEKIFHLVKEYDYPK